MTIESDFLVATKRPAFLFTFSLDSGTRRFWTGRRDLDVEGQTFLGLSNVRLTISIRDSFDLSDLAGIVSLRTARNEIIALALTEPYQNRLATVEIASLDTNLQFSSRQALIVGRITDISIRTDVEESEVETTIEASPKFLQDTEPTLYQTASQQLINPGDLIFEGLEAARTALVPWGN